MYRRIIVPLDGSKTAEQALPEAERLAKLAQSPIHLLRVVDPTQIPWYGQIGMAMEYAAMQESLEAEVAVATSELTAISGSLKERGLFVDIEVRRGQASKEITEATEPGDIVVMASHGRTGLSRWFLGSVAEAVLRHAKGPILLIKAIPEADAKLSEPV